MTTDRLLTTGGAAKALGVSTQTVRRWAASGRLRHVRLPSGRLRFRREDIAAVLEPVEPQRNTA